ncbi:MAG: hypothetical protein AAGU74_14895 [Bacillota bacterium]
MKKLTIMLLAVALLLVLPIQPAAAAGGLFPEIKKQKTRQPR